MTATYVLRERQKQHNKATDFLIAVSLSSVLLFFIVVAFLTYRNTAFLNQTNERVAQTHDVILGVTELLSLVKDAETGQRGYIITGDESYLAPYNEAGIRIANQLAKLEELLADRPLQLNRLPVLRDHIQSKMRERMLEQARNRDAILENRRILIVEDDIANIYALTSILEPKGVTVQIARNGRQAIEVLERLQADPKTAIDLVLMDYMMPEVDGLAATSMIRQHSEWRKLPVIMLTAKAMQDDQERCLQAGANDYMAKPLDVDKLLSLIRVWMPR